MRSSMSMSMICLCVLCVKSLKEIVHYSSSSGVMTRVNVSTITIPERNCALFTQGCDGGDGGRDSLIRLVRLGYFFFFESCTNCPKVPAIWAASDPLVLLDSSSILPSLDSQCSTLVSIDDIIPTGSVQTRTRVPLYFLLLI